MKLGNFKDTGVILESIYFLYILSKYVESNRHQHFIDIFGPHLHDHLKKIDIRTNQHNVVIDKRQIKKKSKKRSKKRSKGRR